MRIFCALFIGIYLYRFTFFFKNVLALIIVREI